MLNINPKFITDDNGNKISVIIPLDEFELLMNKLDEIEDLILYDSSKTSITESIPAQQLYKDMEERRNNRN